MWCAYLTRRQGLYAACRNADDHAATLIKRREQEAPMPTHDELPTCNQQREQRRKTTTDSFLLHLGSRVHWENNPTRRRTMLILTRRVGETIRINDDISIQVLSVSGQQVKIGITAPEDVAVHREEIWKRIQVERVTHGAA